jgi:4,5-dihydroxyphthalate decarboxylase
MALHSSLQCRSGAFQRPVRRKKKSEWEQTHRASHGVPAGRSRPLDRAVRIGPARLRQYRDRGASIMTESSKLTLRTLLGEYPKTDPIREGRITSDLVDLDISEIRTAQKGFKPLVRDLAFDFAEVAIVTFLIARDHGKPYALLPFVMNGAFHHGSLYTNVAANIEKPKDLEGRRIGIRSWTQTTPTWVRGYLMDDYGVDLDTVTWVTFEDSHVAEYEEPANVVRAPAGSDLAEMLVSGEVDAAMMGANAPQDPRVRPLIDDPRGAARAWFEAHQAVPINHMMVVRKDIVSDRPDVVRDLFRMLVESRALGGGSKFQDGVDLQPIGLDNIRNALELAVDYAFEQRLIRTRVTVDELFDEVTASLGRDPAPAE